MGPKEPQKCTADQERLRENTESSYTPTVVSEEIPVAS